MSKARDLMVGLLDYIIEQAKQIDPKAFNIAKSKGLVIRQHDLRGLPGISCDVHQEGDHVWLRIDRLVANPPPAIAENLIPFITAANDPAAQPPVLNQGAVEKHLINLENPEPIRTQIVEAVDHYRRRWTLWAEQEKPRRISIRLYGDLFAIKHQIEAEETASPQELVWGMGMTAWLLPGSDDDARIAFDYPLLTQAMEISVDSRTMALELRPRSVGTRVELDAIVNAGTLGATEVEKAMRAQLDRPDSSVNPFNSSTFEPMLKVAASNLDADGKYKNTQGDGPGAPGKSLSISEAWVLFSRGRSNNFLLEDVKRLKSKVESGTDIPAGPLALVTPGADEVVEEVDILFRGLCGSGSSASGSKVEDLYFPLPYNDEQVTIVQRLETSAGVTVQGPPGTGKTHTIANVICHYLATGRRVLVTSRGEPALEVLQKMIPEEVRPLTVALLASDREGLRQFEASIGAIQHRVSQLNTAATRQSISQHQSSIDGFHRELATIDHRVDAIAATQLSDVVIDGAPMRAQKIAELVVAGNEEHAWFDDVLTLAPEHAPALTEEQASAVRDARRRLGEDLAYLGARLAVPDQLPAVNGVVELHETLTRIESLTSELNAAPEFQLRSVNAESLTAAIEFLRLLEEAQHNLADIEREAPEWGQALREKCRTPSFDSERKALEALFTEIDALTQARADFLQRPVEFPIEALDDARTRQAVTRAAQSGKAFGLMSMGAGASKAHIAAVRVSGLAPADAPTWAHVLRYLDLHQRVVSFLSRWNTFAAALSIPQLSGGVSALRQVEAVTHAARKAHRAASFFDRALLKKSEVVFAALSSQRLLGNAQSLLEVRDALRRHLAKADLAKAAILRSAIQELLAGTTGSISVALRSFFDHDLGQSSIAASLISSRYASLLAELRRVRGLGTDLQLIEQTSRLLAQAGAVRWAHRVSHIAAPASGDDPIIPAHWRNSWTWARMRGHLDSIEARDELRKLARRREEITRGLERSYHELVSESAWLAAKTKATQSVLQALAGYATAIRRIGQGTGPNAVRYRRDARSAMTDAANAVPCWIMSHQRISESMPAEIGLFDLVIVDEASQSDLWALPAILRGKKILVVGDDKQVSPDGSFISGQHIDALRARFLRGQPYEESMTPDKSLYDLAARVFAAHQVMLREHFRCVAPIIAYSNRVFYENEIKPLRMPRASERLDPPLVDLYAPSGYRDKHDINPVEAEAIADEIGAILADPRMSHRTIGVVSLLGMEQAKHIDLLVRARFPATELLKRRFDCGDARNFQGSERDIIFLSLVVDRDRQFALSGNKHEQRFNVGASRARDRMYLVRSVELSDLSEKDLRRTLLSHFEKPIVGEADADADLIGLCDSGFEREVFSMLTQAGYRTLPQVKVGAYRIDLVVEGADDRRLAIELDGDDYHGPNRWAADMNRQRILERAGWTFWRCFASTWSLNKAVVFSELRDRLSAMGIEPIGALERVPLIVEKRVVEPSSHTKAATEVAALMTRVSAKS